MHRPQRTIDRRAFLALTAGGIGAGAAVAITGCGTFEAREVLDTAGRVPFRNRLHIPVSAEPARHGDTKVFDLTIAAGRSTIIEVGETDTWGVNGPLLGPTIRARRGDFVQINVTNALDEATTLHWHGMHLPAAADGGPHQMIQPGATWSPAWHVDQPAATLWYHPHPHGATERHVYRGIGGLFIVEDDDESALELPRNYGIDDIPVIVQDKTFDQRGQLVETARRDNGMIGHTILVNGTAGPFFDVTTQRVRLRLLNASTARSYLFGFSDNRPFAMIATDGGLLTAPTELTRILLTPGERAEIIAEIRPAETVTLRSYPHDLGLSSSRSRSVGATDTLDILLLRAAGQLTQSASLPTQLVTVEHPVPTAAVITRQFELRNNRINREPMDMNRIDAVITVDTTEIWEVHNGHRQPHNFHIHDVQFQIAGIDGRPPPAELSGWKDTVYLPPDVRFTLIMRFTDYADPHTPYMYHCHLLWHEDQGMMGQFVVVPPHYSGHIGPGHPHGH